MAIFMLRRGRVAFILLAIFLSIVLYFFATFSAVIVQQDAAGSYVARIRFYLPLHRGDFAANHNLISEIRGPLKAKIHWRNRSTIEFLIPQTDFPQGELIHFSCEKVRTAIPLLRKKCALTFRLPVAPNVVEISPRRNVPTYGPVKITFSTPIEPQTAKDNLRCTAKGSFLPAREDDMSVWIFRPDQRLENKTRYTIYIGSELRSRGGLKINGAGQFDFITAERPSLVEIKPKAGQKKVMLNSHLVLEFDSQLKEGWIFVPGNSGETKIQGNKLIYHPHALFSPGTTHRVQAQAISRFGEPGDVLEFSFSTISVQGRVWVEVNLRDERIHAVTVYRGKTPTRTMVASGGSPGHETPLGVYYISDRGYSFWSQKYGGAKYWVRFKDNYLFHSIPRDSHWRIIEEEHKKLGLPSSHGCIRLSDEDAHWFYDNVPRGAMVIIYK